jgi:hypothetical protein
MDISAAVPPPTPPIYFVSFATNKYQKTLERIRQQAQDMGIFTEVLCLTEKDIEQEFWDTHRGFIENNPNGHGCWIWKPKIVQKILQQIPYGAILFYCDAGSTLFKEGLPRFKKYIEILLHSKHDNLAFQMSLPEKNYTRKSILDTLEYTNIMSGQLLGGIFFLKKSKYTENLVNLWCFYSGDYNLIGYVSEDQMQNECAEFVQNRNDQSIFSVLRKKLGTTAIRDETYFGEHYNNFKQYPIHATRIKY